MRLLPILTLCVLAGTAGAAQPLVVHEWGTFTALQDENGAALGRINTDDEPVPPFVHSVAKNILDQSHALAFGRRMRSVEELSMLRYASKGFPEQHPLVTLRLETPVLYFYPPAEAVRPYQLNVKATFKGGWLTEFYPNAVANAQGLDPDSDWWSSSKPITPQTAGSLKWNGLTVGASSMLPKTDWHVWLAPRETGAAQLVAANGESEKYLFYRGVGNRMAPVAVKEDFASKVLAIQKSKDAVDWKQQCVPALWLLDVRLDGRSAWRTIAPASDQSSGNVAETPSDFAEGDYQSNGVEGMRKEMHGALVKDGLFGDEATAMLSTWQRAYFESFGKRLFFIVPHAWTDAVLPLEFSIPTTVTRSMIGRIELVGEGQRALLSQLRETPTSDPRWMMTLPDNETTQKFFKRQMPLGNCPLPPETPADYKLYMQLGRFRNAIVLNSQAKKASPVLAEFIKRYGLEKPRAVVEQIVFERPAADALAKAREATSANVVEGYKALHQVIGEFSGSEAAKLAEKEIATLYDVRANRSQLEAVRPGCLLLLLQKTRDEGYAKTLTQNYPSSPEAKKAKETTDRWARERAEAERENAERYKRQQTANP